MNDIREKMEQLSNKELIAILLAHDENQWQPEVFDMVTEILAARGSAAGQSPQYAVGPESVFDETEGMNLKTVAEYMSHLDAEHDRLILENEGVKAWIFEDESAPDMGTSSSVQLKVCVEDWTDAMRRLGSENLLFPESLDNPDEPPFQKD